MNRKSTDRIIYIIADILMSLLGWIFLYAAITAWFQEAIDWSFLREQNFQIGLLLTPTMWLLIFSLVDSYSDLYRQSRLSVIIKTFFVSVIGVILLFVLYSIFNDMSSVGTIWIWVVFIAVQFILFSLSRMIILTGVSRRLKAGKVYYNTLIIGGNENAVDLYNEINEMPKKLGHKFLGFIDSNGNSKNDLEQYLPKLGDIVDISSVIESQNIEEIIIAIETSEHNKLKSIFDIVFDFSHKALIKIIPDMYDIMLGNVQMTHVYGAALIEIRQDLMPKWQKVIKRIIDIVVSLVVLIILSPLYLYIAIRVRLSSPGPIFYLQERIGQYGKPFMIYKFRSMYVGSEKAGPQLSQDDDDRCTSWGSTMRKWRLDELPQAWNVIRGEMSLVGPRPEREYFINLIMKEAPHFKHLLKVRPGITSWGQVKYGYASDVKQMIQRLKFDILYIENMSLSLDIKILFYTILVIVQGKGK